MGWGSQLRRTKGRADNETQEEQNMGDETKARGDFKTHLESQDMTLAQFIAGKLHI